MKWKWAALAAGLLASIIVVGAALVYYLASQSLQDDYAGKPRVVGLPQGYDPRAFTEPFRGVHPSRRPRPPDPYPYPIAVGEAGPVVPTYADALQYPFVCRTEESGLGQPLVDNQEGAGVIVYEEENGRKTSRIAGYSKDCSAVTRVLYYYRSRDTGSFAPYSEHATDVDRVTIAGRDVPFVVRLEMGTINRHVYVIAVVAGSGDTPQQPQLENWNGNLVYQFRGGVGIGRRQGVARPTLIPERRAAELARGYAVAYSTANQTSTQYDIELQEDTVARVKRQFTARYGKPAYTIGIGGSGGAIQQYLIGQNRPGLLDAGIALMSYPDMVTQTVRIMDCELLEYYFDVVDADNDKWKTWSNRRWVEGFNAIDGGEPDPVAQMTALSQLRSGRWPTLTSGQTECTKSWRTLTPLVVNPHHTHFRSFYAEDIAAAVPWTYWDDLKRVFGTDEAGFARRTWDNVGVQYGLQALREEKISVEEFIKLNENIGGWKPASEMQPERYWLFPPARSSLAEFSPWSHHNMLLLSDDGRTARRSHGDLDAIAAAYRSGQVFAGRVSMPVVDLRHYLEPELDMHHTLESFATRLRMLEGQGRADNQLIWVASPPAMPIDDAFDVLERWLGNLRENPAAGVVAAKPAQAADRCYDDQGDIIASGDRVWDGAWNGQRDGTCMQRYPAFSNPRIVAGDSYAGDIFKCHLQSVDEAIAAGVYRPVEVRNMRDELRRIFPDGVCDYARGDAGRPADLFDGSGQDVPSQLRNPD